MSVEKPLIAIGIPLADCNMETPDETNGLPIPPWEIGSLVAGHVYGTHIAQRYGLGTGSPAYLADPLGVGRSIFLDIKSDMDGLPPALGGSGSGNSVIRSGRGHYGFCPAPGHAVPVKFIISLTMYLDLTGDAELHVVLEEISASGSILAQHVFGSLTSSDNNATTGVWDAKRLTGSVVQNTGTRMYRVAVYPESSGTGSKVGWDQVALGWLPLNTGINYAAQAFEEDYVGSGTRSGYRMESEETRLEGHRNFVHQSGRGLKAAAPVTFDFIRIDRQWREDLLFFWQAQNGAPSANDKVFNDQGNLLGNRIWPLLVIPRRTGVKAAMYCRMVGQDFAIDIDNQAHFVESDAVFSGVAAFEEELF